MSKYQELAIGRSSLLQVHLEDHEEGKATPALESLTRPIQPSQPFAEAVGGTIANHGPVGKGTELLAELPLQPVPAPD
jgi:hypothetical protein